MKARDQIGQPQGIERNLAVERGKGYSALQAHFLARLKQLAEQRKEHIQSTPSDRHALRLLSRALYSTYLDCVSAGVGGDADAVLEEAQPAAR